MAAYLSNRGILLADSVCVDQTCSELQPQALIHHTDEHKGSHTEENGLDSSLSVWSELNKNFLLSHGRYILGVLPL